MLQTAAAMDSPGWLSPLDHVAGSLPGQPWEEAGQGVAFSESVIWISPCLWGSVLRWAYVDGPLIG